MDGSVGRDHPIPRWVSAAQEMIVASAFARVSVSEVAQRVGVHPYHLGQVFKASYGCTISEYVQRMRVTRALALLEGSTESLSAVAFACGFADQSHLTRVFKRMTGVTPGAYRRVWAASPAERDHQTDPPV